MAAKKDNLPLTLDQNGDSTGSISYSNEVIAIIAGVAANEVDGIAGMCSTGAGIADVFGRNKNITKGVKVELGSEETAIDIYLIVDYGTSIQTAAVNVQENVRKAVESMTGLHVVRVDVHVQGISFENEEKQNASAIESMQNDQSTLTRNPENLHVEFEGEPTPAETHGPSYVDLEMKREAEAAEATEAPETAQYESEE